MLDSNTSVEFAILNVICVLPRLIDNGIVYLTFHVDFLNSIIAEKQSPSLVSGPSHQFQ